MADVVLFHSAVGLRPPVRRVADRLRAAGHDVSTPDLYDGQVFTDVDEGVAHMRSVGWPELLRRAEAAVADLPSGLVLAGMSLGAGIAATIAAGRPGARGVVLLYGPELPDDPWPAELPVQAHYSIDDPWIDDGTVLMAKAARAGSPVSVHVYPGNRHLLDHDDLPDQHDPAAAELVWRRVEAFLDELA